MEAGIQGLYNNNSRKISQISTDIQGDEGWRATNAQLGEAEFKPFGLNGLRNCNRISYT